jgi:hypothetical protein
MFTKYIGLVRISYFGIDLLPLIMSIRCFLISLSSFGGALPDSEIMFMASCLKLHPRHEIEYCRLSLILMSPYGIVVEARNMHTIVRKVKRERMIGPVVLRLLHHRSHKFQESPCSASQFNNLVYVNPNCCITSV